jgi:protein SCO1/2
MWVALTPLLFLLLLLGAKTGQSDLTRNMGITQHPGEELPLDTPFKDETGKDVKLGDMLHGKPVILVPVFYSCQTGCAMLIDSLIKTLAKATRGDILKPGRDMDVLMYSIDPKENYQLAQSKKMLIMRELTPKLAKGTDSVAWRAQAEGGWHLLTGSMDSIQKLSNSIGFSYSYKNVLDVPTGKTNWLINHPTCTVILTPQGKISTYTIGTDFQTKEVEQDLLVARQGQIGRRADQSSMFGCIMLDPSITRNRTTIENIWKIAGVLTVIILGFSIFSLNKKSRQQTNISGGGLSLH